MNLAVVVADDDFRVASLHRAFVEKISGFEVVGEAYSGQATLDAVARLRPDLLLLDVYLPDLSGLEVLRKLREPGIAHVDVIMITAAQDLSSVRSAMQGGTLDYLVKPFSFARLSEVLESYRLMRAKMAGMQQITQTDIDDLYAAVRSTEVRKLPKGQSPQTLGVIVEALRAAESDLSCEDVAQRTGLSRATAQRYLSHLQRIGRVEVALRYGGGRPEHRYRWP